MVIAPASNASSQDTGFEFYLSSIFLENMERESNGPSSVFGYKQTTDLEPLCFLTILTEFTQMYCHGITSIIPIDMPKWYKSM